MELKEIIKKADGKPLAHQTMLSFFKEYKSPNDKIHQLTKQGILMPLRKGLYVISDEISSPILLANHIYGPSYVSLDYALQHYGAIPEKVYTVTSVTPKKSKEFTNKMGVFSYTHLPMAYYRLGISGIRIQDNSYGMIALPEKALLDKIVTGRGINIRSVAKARDLLLEDLRISEDWLKGLDTNLIAGWLPNIPKRDTISYILKAITQ